jgi:hypothetical protein
LGQLEEKAFKYDANEEQKHNMPTNHAIFRELGPTR